MKRVSKAHRLAKRFRRMACRRNIPYFLVTLNRKTMECHFLSTTHKGTEAEYERLLAGVGVGAMSLRGNEIPRIDGITVNRGTFVEY